MWIRCLLFELLTFFTTHFHGLTTGSEYCIFGRSMGIILITNFNMFINELQFLLFDFRFLLRNGNTNKMSSVQPPTVPPAQSTVTCDGCDAEFDVTWFCKVCPASLCDTCKQRHESDRFLKRHTIVKRTGNVIRSLDVSKIIQPCSEHPEREITVYCKDLFCPLLYHVCRGKA